MCKKNVRTKTICGKTFINIWITKVKLFWKKRGAGVLTLQCNSYLSHVRSFFKISSNFLSLISSYRLEVCKLKYSIKKLGGGEIQALCMVFTLGEIWTLKLMGFFFQKHLMFCSLWSTFFGPQNARFQELPPPGPLTALSLIF
jgi:hypothetical protein